MIDRNLLLKAALEGYREDHISEGLFAEILGVRRWEAQEILDQHGARRGYTLEILEEDLDGCLSSGPCSGSVRSPLDPGSIQEVDPRHTIDLFLHPVNDELFKRRRQKPHAFITHSGSNDGFDDESLP